jgi:hypothetical protein
MQPHVGTIFILLYFSLHLDMPGGINPHIMRSFDKTKDEDANDSGLF